MKFHFICRGPGFEPRPSHLTTLKVEFLATRLHDKKKKNKKKPEIFNFMVASLLMLGFVE
jgi:hypothetical protein